MPKTLRLLLAVSAILLVVPSAAHAAFSFTRTDVPLSGGPVSLAVGDVDNANGPDIVATIYTNTGPSSIAVLLNRGDGTFAGPAYYAACDGAYDTELGDVTTTGSDLAQDGKLDVVTVCLRAAPGRRPGRMAGDGAGGFGATVISPNLPIGQTLFTNDPIELANVRKDGGPPLLVYMTDFFNLSTFEQGEVACVSWDWSTNDCFNRPGFPAVGGALISGRLNGTARDQILTGGGKGFITYGIADGLPNGPSSIWTFSERDAGGAASWMRLADTDGDGHVDVIASRGDSMGGSFSIQHWGASTGIVDGPAKNTTSVPGLEPTVVGDFDGDGHPDVLGITAYGRAVAYAGDGADNFGGAQDVPLLGYGNPSYATVVQAEPIDVDRNGVPDAVVADQLGANLQILRNTTPPAPKPVPVPTAPPPSPGPKPVLPLSGIKGLPTTVILGSSALLGFGSASNPPTASVDLTLTVKATGKASAAGKKKQPKTTRIGFAHIVIPPGKTRKLQVKLSAGGRKLVKARGSLKATLTLAATGTDGSHATKTRTLTMKRAPVKRHKG